jgi:ABC-2 type transport system ATP-binding protein
VQELALEARGLTKRFGKVVALDQLDLALRPGEAVALVGSTAAGKSTAIRCFAGLARPTGGSIMLDGQPMTSRAALAGRRRIGVVGQEPAFHGWMTGRELVAFAADLLGVERDAARERIPLILDRVGLADVADRRIAEYALTLRQRLALAQALVGEPRVLLLDEPLGWLDPAGRSEVLRLLRGLRSSVSMVVATADLALAEATCERTVVLDHGVALATGPTRDVLERAAPREYVLETVTGPGLALAGLTARLDREAWVHEVTTVDSTLRIAVDDDPRAARELMPAIVATGLPVRALRRERPSVESLLERLRGERR